MTPPSSPKTRADLLQLLAEKRDSLALQLIMLVVTLRLRWLAWRNPMFRQKLKKRNTLMQWRTRDGDITRWFHFTASGVRSGTGLRAKSNVTLSFCDARYGAVTLLKVLKNQRVFIAGMRQGKIKLSGSPEGLIWFMTLTGYLIPGGVQLWGAKKKPQQTAYKRESIRRKHTSRFAMKQPKPRSTTRRGK